MAQSDEAAGKISIPEQPGITVDWPDWVDEDLIKALHSQGVIRPWLHQREAAEIAQNGQSVVLATGTASGKSLAYWMPVLTQIRSTGATALYCAPTKALAQDQLSRLSDLAIGGVEAACFDGDTPRDVRPWIRRNGNFVLTNPDMLHRGILPDHTRWTSFLRRLKFIILDEAHHYRGIFGTHMAAIIRRLNRLARLAGGTPSFIITSATLASPESSATQLTNQTVTAVTQDTSARGETTVLLVNRSAEDGGAFGAVSETLANWTSAGARSLGFIRSRSGAESLARKVTSHLGESQGDQVAPYRGGLLPEERRDIEQRLRTGQLRCVATTNALELGVDITGLDAIALCGWPGRRSSFLQQIGRAGRDGQPAVALLAAQQDPLDQFYVRNPDRILADSIEATVLDPSNPYVLLPHLAAATAELPLTDEEATAIFGPGSTEAMKALAENGLVRLRGDRWFWVDRGRATDLAQLRSSGSTVTIIESRTARVLGTVDRSSASAQVHPGAVYVHLGVVHLVEDLDLDDGVAIVSPVDPGYTTVAQTTSDLRVVSRNETRAAGLGTIWFGDVEVSSQVVSFLRRRSDTGQVLGSEPLDLPSQHLQTRSVWWQLPDPDVLGIDQARLPGAAHAAEHAAIGVLPALATCDRWDIGGLSTQLHPDTNELTFFVYDGHAGGAGFARRGFEEAQQWLSATAEIIYDCPCSDGCPSCIQSPKCGNGNEPLDKEGAVALLRALLPTGANSPNA